VGTLQDFLRKTEKQHCHTMRNIAHYEITSKNNPFWVRLNNIDAVTKLPHLLTLQLDNNEVTISDQMQWIRVGPC